MTKLKPRPFKFLQYHWRTTRFGPSTPLLTNHRTADKLNERIEDDCRNFVVPTFGRTFLR